MDNARSCMEMHGASTRVVQFHRNVKVYFNKTGTFKAGAISKAQKAQFLKYAWDVFMGNSCFQTSASSLLKSRYSSNITSRVRRKYFTRRQFNKIEGGPFGDNFEIKVSQRRKKLTGGLFSLVMFCR